MSHGGSIDATSATLSMFASSVLLSGLRGSSFIQSTMDTDVGDPEGSRAVAGAEAADKAPMEGISSSPTGDDMVADQVQKAAAPDEERPSAQAADAHRHDDEEPPDNIDVFPPQSQESAAMSTLTPSQDYLDEYESEGLTEAELRGLGVEKDNRGAPSGAAAGAAAASAAVGGRRVRR